MDNDFKWTFKPQQQKKLPWRELAFLVIVCICMVGILFLTRTNIKNVDVLPPTIDAKGQTYAEVLAFINADNTNQMTYGQGFNCVDFVFRVWRNATWQGISSIPIAVQFEQGSGHMVIGFPTADHGDIFFETETDQRIALAVGENYGGKIIRGFYYMDVSWGSLANSPPYDPSIGTDN